MNSPKISIVIPSYNKVKYIEKTLKSIVEQKYKNFEVIIQDGGSTDGTLNVIKKYSKKYSKHITFVSKKDKGQLDAINTGLKKATGEILTFINADDVYEKGAFESVVGHYLENPTALWFAGKGIVVDGKGNAIAKIATKYKNMLLHLNNYSLLLVVNYLMQPSVFLTKKGLKKIGKFKGTRKYVLEYDSWLKLGREQMPVIIKRNLSRFRIDKSIKSIKFIREISKSDREVVSKYVDDKFILLLHDTHNFFRWLVSLVL